MGKGVGTASDLSGKPVATADIVEAVSPLPNSLTPIMEWGHHFNTEITEIKITIEWYRPPRVPNPTADELSQCPATFRCYACQERKGRKRHFGGVILYHRICRECYPYVDATDVGTKIRFDLWHNIPVRWEQGL